LLERVDVRGWIAGTGALLKTGIGSLLVGQRLWGILRTVEMGLWIVAKVSLLLILTLQLLLLVQNSFLVLQERVVNENAVDGD
jgi:hypothetical protein